MAGEARTPDRWLMPADIEVEPVGSLRFLVQPRWAAGPYDTWASGLRRRALPDFTELEIEVRYEAGSLVAVAYLLPYPRGGLMVATSFGQALEPIRRLMYGPKDEQFRKRVWDELYATRPLFMGVNDNGLYGRVDDLALLTQPDPVTGARTNLVVSVDRDKGTINLGDEALIPRIAGVVSNGLELLEETTKPLNLMAAPRSGEAPDGLEVAGAAAKWVFNNAGKIKDMIDLVRVFSG